MQVLGPELVTSLHKESQGMALNASGVSREILRNLQVCTEREERP